MEAQFEIHTIKFNSLSDWLILNGRLQKGMLSSELLLKVQQSMLNKILNRLQHKNPEISINDYLKSHQDNYLSDFEFNFESLENKFILMNEIKKHTNVNDYRFIRA
jgi:hypothetical protein